MIRGEKVGLRARTEADVPILHTELYEDVATAVRADGRAWRPLAVTASPFAIGQESDTTAAFSVVELASGELAGEASLWGVDLYNRSAHLGLALRPGFRGRGLATDAVRVLSYYGFAIRGLHRLQVETLADNDPMRRAAERCGYVLEGTRRQASWVSGDFLDEVFLGLLAPEWSSAQKITPGSA